jgi:uncharacterized RDD family membrane protein YckC
MDSQQCPLCGTSDHMHKAMPLYNHMVCRKCYYKFANRRQFAFFIDVVCWRLLTLPLFVALGFAMGAAGVSVPAIKLTAGLLAYLLLLIFICKDSFFGHSPGKALMGVKAVDKTSGVPIGIGASFKRNLPLMIPFMPLIVAIRLCKGNRTGDGWSNSKVIWKKYELSPVFLPESDQVRVP